MEKFLLTPYFTQTSLWAEFWQEANKAEHYKHEINVGGVTTWIYEYPWYFGQNFLYLPSGPVLPRSNNKEQLNQALQSFKNQLLELSQKTNSAFIKCELDPYLSYINEIDSAKKGLDFVQNIFNKNKVKISSKRIMYISTILLEADAITFENQNVNNEVTTEQLVSFFENNKQFWSKVNEGHRSKTRKSLKQNWSWSTQKTTDNFEKFWQLYSHTSQRQSFTTQPKEYFQKLFQKPDSRIIILNSPEGNAEAVWFGLSTKDSIIYLYGGNSDYSMKYFGQYLIHLIALYQIKIENKSYYDLGGYDPKAGYGVFKERYKGVKLDFIGPFDIILKPIMYSATNFFLNVFRIARKVVRKSNHH